MVYHLQILILKVSIHDKKAIMKAKVVTARKRSLGQGGVFTPVCHSVHREGLHPGGLPPGGLHWRGGSASRGVCMRGGGEVGQWAKPPPYQILWDTVNEPAVHILLECILVFQYVLFH